MSGHKYINELIRTSRTILETAQNDADLHAQLSERGVEASIITHGITLLEELTLANDAQRTVYDRKKASTKEAYAAVDAMYESYIVHVDLVRSVFRDQPAVLEQLGATGRRGYTRADQIIEPRIFYEELEKAPELIEPLAPFGLTAEEVARQLGEVEKAERADAQQLRLVNEGVRGTSLRDGLAVELRNFMRSFRGLLKQMSVDDEGLRERYRV